ncbi:acyl-CoA thioesterase [Arcanobacterium buesumense]|uniref:Acyl-CoA thioesterase II n=1 Tax=Arcanobacterium buesumense TaxID=2722751 RepID=A0A6H2EJZ2_9ACTO|nr:acyl-CoA thioesterase domain-containing protein [Arcanobacterium buesumense]QJC21464.1 acyl-CoA thioesterase II [Arcanobacterium buesumense]
MTAFLPVPQSTEEPLASILRTLRLRVREPGSYTGTNLSQINGRVYGGQVFGQAVMSAWATVMDTYPHRDIHSITAAFIRPGDQHEPINFDVEEVNDSRSFSTRRVHASQHGKTILSCRASFQEQQPGVEHSSSMPWAPHPHSLESSVEFFANFDHPASKHMHTTSAIDMRHVDGPIWVKPAIKRDGHTLIWFKSRNPMPAGTTQLLHRAMLAFATDQFMLEPVMRRHGMFWLSPDISLATLDHAIWWHRDVDMADWVLAELDSPSAQGGRGLSIAKFFQNGVHIATMAQEGMTRTRNIT